MESDNIRLLSTGRDPRVMDYFSALATLSSLIEPGILGIVEPYRILVYRLLFLWGTTAFPFDFIHKHDVSE